jgi:hypothetical protein
MTRPVVRLLLLLTVATISFFEVASAATPDETPEPYASLPGRLQPRALEFPLVAADTNTDTATITTVVLNQKPEVFDSGHAFDAIRIRTPKQPGLDLVWAFSTAASWRHWYIIPASGEPKRGFKNWFDGDRAYIGFDGDLKKPITLQSLDAAYFEPDSEYLIWFCQTKHTPEPATLKITFRFVTPPKNDEPWGLKNMEETLKLEAAPVAAQAAYFKSRGANILRDQELFHPEDAASQMDHFLFTRRQTELLKGGYYITIETSCPPCHGKPLLADITRKYGPPDCVLTVGDQNAVRSKDSNESAEYDRHYYDFFVFETDPADVKQRVVRVSSQYFDTTTAKPDNPTGSTWADIKLIGTDFRFFYHNGQEVARYINWQMPGAKLVSGDPTLGDYTLTYDNGAPMEKLRYTGKGNWLYASYYKSGPLYRRCTYLDGKLEGTLTDYFENGSKRAQVNYRQGVLHGQFQVWGKDGLIERDQTYADGKPEPRR